MSLKIVSNLLSITSADFRKARVDLNGDKTISREELQEALGQCSEDGNTSTNVDRLLFRA